MTPDEPESTAAIVADLLDGITDGKITAEEAAAIFQTRHEMLKLATERLLVEDASPFEENSEDD